MKLEFEMVDGKPVVLVTTSTDGGESPFVMIDGKAYLRVFLQGGGVTDPKELTIDDVFKFFNTGEFEIANDKIQLKQGGGV